jgi:autophagy-related protein 16
LFFSLADSVAVNTTLRAEIQMYQNNIKELENMNQMLKDEHQALQLAFASLEEKLRKAQVHTIIVLVL